MEAYLKPDHSFKLNSFMFKYCTERSPFKAHFQLENKHYMNTQKNPVTEATGRIITLLVAESR
jgi:hypothetical protein